MALTGSRVFGPVGASPARAVVSAVRDIPRPRGRAHSALVRTGVFAVGAVLVLLGAAAWLFSMLLTTPLTLAGLWVWSREFDWAHRLLERCHRWSRALWKRVRARPLTWGCSTALSLAATTTAYWWLVG